MNAAFKSEPFRLAKVRSIRDASGEPFFADLMFNQDALHSFEFVGYKAPTCRTEHICWFDHTQTSVQRLIAGGDQIVMKVYRLKDSSDIPHHDIEVLMLTLMSRLIRKKVSPHFVLPIGSQLVSGHRANILTGRELKDGSYNVILSEHADTSLSTLIQQMTLTKFELKCLLFQVIYTLAAIQQRMPTFRHNDLHASNVLVQLFDHESILKTAPDACVVYDYDGVNFFLPVRKCNMRALLWDFFYASCKENPRLLPTRHEGQVYSDRNRYYDMHKLIDSLHYLMPTAKGEIREFIDAVVPDAKKCMYLKLPAEERMKLGIESDEFLTAKHVLLHNSYFHELKKIPPKIQLLTEYRA
jgi:hypothetical protein